MKYFFENVFYRKSEGAEVDEFLNSSYWLILSTANILKWLFACYLLTGSGNYVLFTLLFISPFIKFMLISLGNIYKFRRVTKNGLLITIMVFILLIESFLELPCHAFFPKNYIYLHTNYYKIYDVAKYKQVEISLQLFENFLVLLFVYFNFSSGNIGVITILTLTFSLVTFLYFIMAEIFFLFFADENPVVEVDEYGRTTRRHKLKAKLEEYKKRHKLNYSAFELKRNSEIKNRSDNVFDNIEDYGKVEVLDKRGEGIEMQVKYTETERSSDILTK